MSDDDNMLIAQSWLGFAWCTNWHSSEIGEYQYKQGIYVYAYTSKSYIIILLVELLYHAVQCPAMSI